MRLSLNWLADFVDLTLEAPALAERLTMAGLEVEGVEPVTPEFSGVVVGKVLSVDPHPQADRLQVTEVTTGSQTYIINSWNLRPLFPLILNSMESSPSIFSRRPFPQCFPGRCSTAKKWGLGYR